MYRTMIVAIYDSVFVDAHVVVSSFTAQELQDTYQEIQGAYPGCLSGFYKTLGFVNLRRSADVLQFIDLDRELDGEVVLPEDLCSAIGIKI